MRPRYRVKRVYDGTLKDYAGMNRPAARKLGYPMPKKIDIIVDGRMSRAKQAKTILHERVEARLIRRGLPYWEAHKQALRAEGRK
jgi:hypothetical protein